MSEVAVDSYLLYAWLTTRSVARGLPAPVPDQGGFRVDTNSDTEICRWVFPRMEPGLVSLGRTLKTPGYLLKLCGSVDELRVALPPRWSLQPATYFMRATRAWDGHALPEGYAIEVEQTGVKTQVRVTTSTGEIAASGYAAETADAFVYDRIITAPEHRRRGLGSAMMVALRGMRRDLKLPELLVATEDGHALYRRLGWRTLSIYSTGLIESA